MAEKLLCRFCGTGSSERQFYLGQSHQRSGSRSFLVSGASLHYAPDRPFQLEHIRFELKANPKERSLSGTVTQRVKTIASGQSVLKLDQVGLKIENVKISSSKAKLSELETAKFKVEGDRLFIQLQEPKPGDILEFAIQYKVQNPRRGVYFTAPDSDHPNKLYQLWTQGQDEDSRHWFPTLDYPNQKATSEILVTVPKGFTAVSNGALLSREDVSEGVRFHYQIGTPHVPYLVSLVVGEFSEVSEKGPRNLNVQYFVPAGREEDGKRAFSNTSRMIEAFEAKTGIPYPYEKYSQVAVQDFIFGGMENTSATTQTDMTLHDQRAHLDFSSDPLVSHELAHQWFGDLITCRDWSHGWLNEGFATFMERVWIENNKDADGGPHEAKYYSYQDWKEYLADDQEKYRRPIVCNTYIEPIDLFDTHLYQKGGLVLNLIRYVLGEDGFWKSIQLYLTRHRGQNVETLDLIRAIEDTTGRNLRRLFDEWVFNAGYPEFEVTYAWHEDKKLTEWVIEQKQTGGATCLTQNGSTTYLFHVPVVLEMTLAGGEKVSHRIDLENARERIFLPAGSQPLMVRLDPGNNIPKTLKFPRSSELLHYQLKNDPDCMGRIEAIQELVKLGVVESVNVLAEAVQKDSFWGVQAEAAKGLAGLRMDASRDALIAALSVKHPKARREIVTALGTYRDQKSIAALKKLAEQDESYYVEADSIYAWALSSMSPHAGTSVDLDSVEKFLLSKLKVSSYREVIRSSALKALAELPGVSDGRRPQTLQTLIEWSTKDKTTDVRVAAVRSLGSVLKRATVSERSKILQVFGKVADEDQFRVRMQLVISMEGSGCAETVPILSKIEMLDADGRVKRAAKMAIHHLLTEGDLPDSVSNLKTAYEKLEEDTRKLRSLVEEQRRIEK